MPIAALPGAEPFAPELQERLAALELRPTAPGHTSRWVNRLALETSPYLLQHAHNPVSWWPWCDEAFAEARRLKRPVFLSIGYATCHWCHVMEHESFEDEEIAATLNSEYVSIKVDREERPDVDAVYMAAVQALTGGGGWPLSVFLDADRTPFVGATYFPARDGDRGATRGFLSVLREIARAWREDAPRVKRSSTALGDAVRAALASDPPDGEAVVPGAGPIHAAVKAYEGAFDPVEGGLRQAPKFPSTLPVRLLLRYHRRARHEGALRMAILSLERMAAGGLMDQLAGGFHRYATDARWLVPHFEKMLYDNALLAVAYVEAWQVTGRADLARVARQTLDYLLRELALPDGAFAAATDADSEGEEGRYFVWDAAEVEVVLGDQAADFAGYFGVTRRGNFEGRNILHVPAPDEERWGALTGARARLLAARAARVPPLRDDKVIAAWNGLAISALAIGGRALGEQRYVQAAARAADFVLARMRPAGRLARTFAAGRPGPTGFLADHAFVIGGLLDLHEATFEPRWLEEGVTLANAQERLFADPRGGWFTSGADGEQLIAREKPTHDGAEPSGASVACLNALRLEAFTGEARWREIAHQALRWYAPTLEASPTALSEMLIALDAFTDTVRQTVLVWPAGADPEPLASVLRSQFLPHRALTGASEGEALDHLARVAPVAGGRRAVGDHPTAYVCEGGACRLPVISPEKLAEQLRPVCAYPE